MSEPLGGLLAGALCPGQTPCETCVSSIADNLPVATRLEFYSNREEEEKKKEKDVQFEHGYRLGFMDGNKVENPAGAEGCPGSSGCLWEALGVTREYRGWECPGRFRREWK